MLDKVRRESGDYNPGRGFFIFFLVAAFAIVVSRRPDAISNPQFWAEDGKLFYADAYNKGALAALFLLPKSGYLVILPRLIADFSQLFPLSWAPLIFNLSIIIIRLLPMALLLSSRFDKLIPNWWTRLLLSFLYITLPNSWEVNASLASAQFHVSLLAFMVLSAGRNNHPFWLIFDSLVILLAGLSGPFYVALTPLAVLFWLVRRDKRSFTLFILMAICACIQGVLMLNAEPRPQLVLGASPELFFRIFTTQVFMGALVGQRGLELVLRHSWVYNSLTILFAVVGITVFIKAMVEAPSELKLFNVYALLLFVAALSSPLVNLTDPQWPLLLLPGVGGRYWFIPMVSFVSVLIWSAGGSGSLIMRRLAALALAVMIIGIIADWHYPAFQDMKFRAYARRFESAPAGSETVIPINPPGWSMPLLKKR